MATGTKKINSKIYKVDAKGKVLGRIATEVASIIMGKNKPNFEKNISSSNVVIISNIDKVKISEKKLDKNIIYRFTGYPGGIKRKKWREIYEKNPQELFIKIVKNMISDNKLKKLALKRIKFD